MIGLGLACFPTAQAFAAPPAAPQLLPYSVSVLAGGGPSTYTTVAGSSPTAAVTVTPVPFTKGQPCAAGSPLTSTDTYGNGCLATQVGIVTPRAVVTDSQGNAYLVDSYNYEIRRVDAHTGIITAYAGGGTMGASSTSPTGPTLYQTGQACTGSSATAQDPFGDGCLANQVALAAPEGLAIDGNDNVWFSDYNLGSVREVIKATGVIQTIVNVAGTSGYMAGNVADPGVVVSAAKGMLQHPYGLAFDNNNNLYIADNYNNLVDAVNLGSSPVTIAGVSIPAGAIYTIAGSGCTYSAAGRHHERLRQHGLHEECGHHARPRGQHFAGQHFRGRHRRPRQRLHRGLRCNHLFELYRPR